MNEIDLRLGAWQKVIRPNVEEFDVAIMDPPYTKRTKIGQRSGSNFANGLMRNVNKPSIPYDPVVEKDMTELVEFITERCKWYAVIFNDHKGFRWLEEQFEARNWFVAPPVPWFKTNAAPKMNAIDPDPDCEWICIARRKIRWPRVRKGNRDGFYMTQQVHKSESIVTGQKPLNLMRRIMRDYTLEGDLVVDCFAGAATTAIAAAQEGCRCITAELDPKRYKRALNRVAAGYTVDAFSRGMAPKAKPLSMFDKASFQKKEEICAREVGGAQEKEVGDGEGVVAGSS